MPGRPDSEWNVKLHLKYYCLLCLCVYTLEDDHNCMCLYIHVCLKHLVLFFSTLFKLQILLCLLGKSKSCETEIQNRAGDVAQKWCDLVACITPQKKRGKERKKLKTENQFF